MVYGELDTNLLKGLASQLSGDVRDRYGIDLVVADKRNQVRCNVDPAVVSVVIKSDKLQRRTPRTGQTVRVDGHRGLSVVIRVDLERRVADVMQRTGLHKVVEDVPFTAIHPVSKEISDAIHQFLES